MLRFDPQFVDYSNIALPDIEVEQDGHAPIIPWHHAHATTAISTVHNNTIATAANRHPTSPSKRPPKSYQRRSSPSRPSAASIPSNRSSYPNASPTRLSTSPALRRSADSPTRPLNTLAYPPVTDLVTHEQPPFDATFSDTHSYYDAACFEQDDIESTTTSCASPRLNSLLILEQAKVPDLRSESPPPAFGIPDQRMNSLQHRIDALLVQARQVLDDQVRLEAAHKYTQMTRQNSWAGVQRVCFALYRLAMRYWREVFEGVPGPGLGVLVRDGMGEGERGRALRWDMVFASHCLSADGSGRLFDGVWVPAYVHFWHENKMLKAAEGRSLFQG